MARCEDCIYSKMCYWIAVFGEKTPCEHFLSPADVVPKSEVEMLKRQLEPFKEVQCFTCKHYDIGHDHVPCCYCEDYDKYIWLSADADTDIYTSDESEFDSIPVEVAQVLKYKAVEKAKTEVAREIFAEIDKVREDCTITVDDRGYFQLTKFEKNIAELKKKYTGGSDMKCAYNIDGNCVNLDCPYRADYCPVYEDDSICKYRKEDEKP